MGSKKKEFNPIWFVRREKKNLEFINNESSPSDEGSHSSQTDCPEKELLPKGDGTCHPSSSTSNNNNNDDEMEIIFQSARTVKPLEPETEDDNLTITTPEIAHASNSDEHCPNCFKNFHKLDRLMVHRKICHLQLSRPAHLTSLPSIRNSSSKFLCKLCGRSFKQKIDLGSHLQCWHFDKKRSQCPCKKAFTSRHLLEHMKNSRKKIISTSSRSQSFRFGYKHYFCNKKSKCGQPPKQQSKRRFLHTKFSCPVCAKKFKQQQKDEFSNHMRSHSRHRDTSIICKLCGMLFNGKPSLIHHLQNHSFSNVIPNGWLL